MYSYDITHKKNVYCVFKVVFGQFFFLENIIKNKTLFIYFSNLWIKSFKVICLIEQKCKAIICEIRIIEKSGK